MNVSEPLFEASSRLGLAGGCGSEVKGLVAGKRQVPVGLLNRRPGGHHRPRGIEGTHPGRVSHVRNVETPLGSGR